MKSLRKKLFLSMAATAVCAATLITSSTYAWYTSNTSVTANAISASSAETITSSSLFIATATGYGATNAPTAVGNYSSTVTPKPVSTTSVLEPVYYNATDTTYKRLTAGSKTAAYDAAEVQADVLEYVLFVGTGGGAAGADINVYLEEMTVVNTVAAAMPSQTALNIASGSGIDEAGTYTVDMRHALKMNATFTQMEGATTIPTEDTTVVNYDLENFADTTLDDNVTVTASNNAIGYYNNVLGATLAAPTAPTYKNFTTASTGSIFFTIEAGSYGVMIRFTIYLDGWDTYNYDVCRQQGVTVAMKLTTASASGTVAIA